MKYNLEDLKVIMTDSQSLSGNAYYKMVGDKTALTLAKKILSETSNDKDYDYNDDLFELQVLVANIMYADPDFSEDEYDIEEEAAGINAISYYLETTDEELEYLNSLQCDVEKYVQIILSLDNATTENIVNKFNELAESDAEIMIKFAEVFDIVEADSRVINKMSCVS